MARAGYERLDARQTLFAHPDAMSAPDPVKPGTGEGAFIAIRGWKPK
jgi:hypothetical protein